tara:strand:- start:124 stop:336 length:213 start_codon:yes stop_codon:yes gene_type:complete
MSKTEVKTNLELLEAVLDVANEGVIRLERQASIAPKDDKIESKNRRMFALARLNRARRAVQELEHKIIFS